MFPKEPSKAEAGLQDEIVKLLNQLHTMDAKNEDYAKVSDQLAKLYKLQEVDSKKRVSKETMAVIAGNLAGILIVIGYERTHIITSKALGFVTKLR